MGVWWSRKSDLLGKEGIYIVFKSEELKHKTWMATLCFYVFLFKFGWITGGWEAYSCNYRHYVTQCSVSPLAWWGVSGDRTTIDIVWSVCVAIEFHDHYYTTPFVPAAKYYSDNSHTKAVVKKYVHDMEWIYKRWLVILMFEIVVLYACTDFFAVKTLRFTCLSIKLVGDWNIITRQNGNFRWQLTLC